MTKFENCKSLNDIARQEFGKANYTNREKAKKLLFEYGIDWRDWLESIKNSKRKFCLVCGKELNNEQTKFCGNSCAATYNNSRRKLSLETRTKISHSLQKKSENFNGEFKPLKNKHDINRICKNCGKQLLMRQNCFCNNKCQQDYQYKIFIDKWKNGDEKGIVGEYATSKHIRRFLLEKSGCKCEKCGWGEKNPYTNTIPLEIHHIDGDYTNNKEENLQVLCPNCHSLTETHKSHNKNGRQGRRKYYKNNIEDNKVE